MADTKTEITLPTNWRDFGERMLRAFYTGSIGAATALGLFEDGISWSELSNLEHVWKPIVAGGLLAVFTAAKAAIFQGRGSNPSDGSAK